jgi:hypothetical protein
MSLKLGNWHWEICVCVGCVQGAGCTSNIPYLSI